MNIANLSDVQAEAGIIGTLIYHPDYITHSDCLKPSYFFQLDNSCIYWGIQELYKQGVTNIDAYNLSSILQSNKAVKKTIERYNLPTVHEFIELYKETARNTLEEYKMLVNTVVSLAFKRDLVKKFNELISVCYDPEYDLDALSNATYGELDRLTSKFITGDEVQVLGDVIDDIWAEIEDRRTDDGMYGIPSKYPVFNDYFTYEPGELVVIQAKYKEGKSVLMMNEVVHKLKNGIPTLVVDTEMRTRLYVERLIAHLTGIELSRVKNGCYTAEEGARIAQAKKWIKEQPFVHVYDPNITNEKLYTICKKLKYSMDLQFVNFDYLKANETSSSDNYNVLGAKCDYLKNNIAGELNLAVLAAAQLNRNGEVADSIKINRYLSVGIKWEHKTQEMIAKDSPECGNYYAKIYVNRLGEQMQEDDEEAYIDFHFDKAKMTIYEAKQHIRRSEF